MKNQKSGNTKERMRERKRGDFKKKKRKTKEGKKGSNSRVNKIIKRKIFEPVMGEAIKRTLKAKRIYLFVLS